LEPALLTVNPGGYAFARRLEGEGSVFIPPGAFAGCLDGDEVEIRAWPSEKGFEGRVERVTKRGRERLVGILHKHTGSKYYLEMDDRRIIWPVRVKGGPNGAFPGEVVAARITEFPNEHSDIIWVEVEKALGQPGDRETEILRILVEHGVDPEFPREVLEAAKDTPTEVLEADLEGRKDLRHLPFMTIDPPDARDFDDAVCVVEENSDPASLSHRLYVAVADVSHYLREGSVIDLCAQARCFSTYLPDRAIPMLPEQLSTHICSLVPEQDRLAMVVSMRVDASGVLSDPQVMASVIHSRRRLTYADAAKVLGKGRSGEPRDVQDRIGDLRAVADRLRARRLREGAVELHLDESKVILDEDDKDRIRDVVKGRSSKEMSRAYNLIEELMLAANEAVGTLAMREKLPIVYRCHESPDEEKIDKLVAAAELFGLELKASKLLKPRGMQKFLGRAKHNERVGALNNLTLRAMKQADYRVDNAGHFALASPAYVHFTSPIRRYPDLIAHRVFKAHVKRKGGHPGPEPVPDMPKRRHSDEMAVRSSKRERVCSGAEWDTKSLFAALFMRDRIGDRFDGTVTGMNAGGFFVQLDSPFVDGMVRMADLQKETGESFELDESGVRMVGQRSGKLITLGDRVTVEVLDASPARRQIDLYPMHLSGSASGSALAEHSDD
jgi:ribonuclease R